MKRLFYEMNDDIEEIEEEDKKALKTMVFNVNDIIETSGDKLSVNVRNKHSLDDLVTFEEEGHVYWKLNRKKYALSVTGLISLVSWPFIAEEVITNIFRGEFKKKSGLPNHERRVTLPTSKYFNLTRKQILIQWAEAPLRGTYMHNLIHLFYGHPAFCPEVVSSYATARSFITKTGHLELANSRTDVKAEVNAFLNFAVTLNNAGWHIYRTEWCIADPDRDFAGSIDAVFVRHTRREPEYRMIDWKFASGDFNEKKGSDKYLCYPWNDLPNNDITKYSGQLCLYGFVLRNKYQLNLTQLSLVQFLSTGQVLIHEVPYNEQLVLELLKSWSMYQRLIETLSSDRHGTFIPNLQKHSFEFCLNYPGVKLYTNNSQRKIEVT